MTEKVPKNAEGFICELCDFKCCKLSDWNRHISTQKHLDIRQNGPEKRQNYKCEYCDVICSKLSKWNNHILTAKHIKNKNFPEKRQTIFACKKCNKSYKSNNKFNINVFLNEQCKDALNFTEFVKNIEISYQDLENNAQLGFVQGISKIFMDNLKQLGVNERPIHCTDVKRETMYIKDEDKWTKETDDSKLQKAIQTVSYKSMGKLMEWKQENPDYQDADSEFSKRCLDIQRQSLAGSDRDVYYPKVIHVLAKETMVDK
jgi:hypothetical protein